MEVTVSEVELKLKGLHVLTLRGTEWSLSQKELVHAIVSLVAGICSKSLKQGAGPYGKQQT